MSGHSKWATIHRQKEAADQKRGQIFTKVANAITVAVREGGGIADPNLNFRLRLALEKAKEVNMPKENIQRAIDRAIGVGEGKSLEEVTYEGYAPGGVAIIVEAATDNRQRTVQEVKNIFERGGGSLGTPGAVSFLFKKMGMILVEKGENTENTILKLIDLGVEEVEEVEDGIESYIPVELLEEIKNKISQSGIKIIKSELTLRPISYVPINDSKTAEKILNLMDKLDSHNDVIKVYANFDIPQEILAEIKQGEN